MVSSFLFFSFFYVRRNVCKKWDGESYCEEKSWSTDFPGRNINLDLL